MSEIAKFRDPEKPGRWYLTDFTMEQVEKRLTQAEAELANHADTLKGIASMNPSEGDRMQQWAKDALSGYTGPLESTVKQLQERAQKAEAEREKINDLITKALGDEDQPDLPLIARVEHTRNLLRCFRTERDALREEVGRLKGGPTVVTLCGSTKFKQEFIDATFRETMAGKIVLSVGWFSHADGDVYTPSQEENERLDELHKRKIDLSDEVLILNVGGYIGDSTRSEMEYAKAHGKKLRFLQAPGPVDPPHALEMYS